MEERLLNTRRPAMKYLAGTILLAILSGLTGCDRLAEVPRPDGIPEGSVYSKNLGIWESSPMSGTYSLFYDDASLATRGMKEKGLRVGLWKSFTPAGIVASEGNFKNDWRDGLWKFFDDTGKLYLTVEYKPEPHRTFGFLVTHDYGNENGPYRRYYPDGRLEEQGNFSAGYFEGPVVRFHPDGTRAMEGTFHKDLKEGLWLYYYPGGLLRKEERYSNGILDGKMVVYHPDGRTYHISYFEKGKRVKTDIIDSQMKL